MQNTSKIPNIPNYLVKNFFIAGVNQDILACKYTNPSTALAKILENKAYNIEPEVLFSMYQQKERVTDYLQFVFPEKVAVEYNAQDPKFYTFMTTDAEGFNTYIHVLIFYEEINEAEINSEDFDIVGEILRKQHQTKKHQSTRLPASRLNRDGSGTQYNKQLSVRDLSKDGMLFQRNLASNQRPLPRRRGTKQCLNVCDLRALRDWDEKEKEDLLDSPQTPKGTTANQKMNEIRKMKEQMNLVEMRKKIEEDKKKKMENILNNIHIHGIKPKEDAGNITINHNQSYFGASQQDAKLTGGFSNPGHTPSRVGDTSEQKGNQSYVNQKAMSQHIKNAKPVLKKHSSRQLLANIPTVVLETESGQSKDITLETLGDISTFEKAANKVMMRNGSRPISNSRNSKVFHTQDDYTGMQKIKKQQRFGQTQIGLGHYEEPIGSNTREAHQDQEMGFEIDAYFINQLDNEHENQLKELENKRYVPVALCLETETEYHDTFRQIMLSIFDLIREPENLVTRFYDNRTLAFAELVAHLAFLRTIPAPPFNSVYNIHCLNQVFQIKESSFDQIPNKNQYPIRILFDVLDVRSIFYCWKALLFDKTLVLVSSQYSLQFYIAEALKQLLFPMTWQNTYIQPGNETLAGHCDGTMVCLYGSNSMVNGFDFFEALQHPEICICDIDAGFTNNIDLPCIPDETMYIRILNMLKNSKINQYDKAYPDSQIPDAEDFVSQVRETFFGLLKPFLTKVEEFIDCSVDNQSAFFQKYFKQQEYLEHFENYGQLHYKFAKALTESSQFQHFCDDFYQDEDLNNYKMLIEIYKSRGEIHINPRNSDQKKKGENMLEAIKSIEELQKKKSKKDCLWPDTDPVTFNFRMPTDHQRVMLFEKILYMIESSLRKRERDITRKTNENIIMNKESLLYEKVIQTIKTLYPIKLKGTHKKFAFPDAKLQQMHLQKRFGMQSTIEITTSKPQQKTPYAYQPPLQSSKRKASPDTTHLVVDQTQIASFVEQRANSKINKSRLQKQNSLYVSNSQFASPNQPTKNSIKDQLVIGEVRRELLPQLVDKSMPRIPMEGMNSEFGGNSSMMSESHLNLSDYLIKIGLNKQRIAKLMYGKQGLVSFLNHLFGLLSKKQLLRVNYYFAIKQQIDQMTVHAKKQSQQKMELRRNIPIPEEGFDDDKSPAMNQAKNTMRSPQESSMTVSQGLGVAQKSHSSQSTFKSDKEWVSIDHWDIQGCILKKTYQVSLFKQKIYESFENPEDGYSLVWKELLKFPVNKMKFFPTAKYLQIWESLTNSQQQEVFAKFGQKQDKPQIQLICKQYVKRGTYNRASTDPTFHATQVKKNNEDILYNNSIEKTWKQKQIEKKESLLASKSSQKHDSTSSLVQFSPKEKESHQKQEAKKQKVIDSNQRTIQDFLKQKLESKKLKSQEIFTQNTSISSKSMKCTPPSLTMRSATSEQSIFKGGIPNVKEDSPPNSARLPKQSSYDSRPSMSTGSRSVLQHKKSDSTLSFQPPSYQMGDISAMKSQEQKVKIMSEPYKHVNHLLDKIQKFWKRSAQYVTKSGAFKEDKLEMLQEDLKTFDKYFTFFKTSKPLFEGNNIGKQCFFLNLFNFLVLYQMAVLMLSNPDAVNRLVNYNMWQAFLVSASIKIAYVKLTAFNIMHSILRNSLSPPQITAFMLNTQITDYAEQTEFKIIHPNKLICFGFYLPLKRMPELRIFKQDEFEDQLRTSAYLFLIDRVKVKDDQHLIILPKILQWYSSDSKAQYFTEMLEFIEKKVFLSERILQIQRVLDKIQSKQTNANDYVIEYQSFSWEFDPQLMMSYFGDKPYQFSLPTNGTLE